MKKMFTLLLALIMVVSAAPMAFARESDLPIVNEPLTLTIAVLRHGSDATENFNEKAFAIKAEEETGIHIEWIELSGADTEKLAVLLAGEHPDAYMGVLTDDMIAENPDMFMPINTLINEYCPNVVTTYEELEGWEQFLTYPDGNIYGMASFIWEDINESVASLPWINQTWLDKIDAPMPTTLDELYNVLVAFRDNDMDGDGDTTNEIPLNFCEAHWGSHIIKFAYPWGLASSNDGFYKLEDGVVAPTANTLAFREFLEYFHKLGQEGLLNLEGFSTTVEQYNAQMDAMTCGMFIGWGPNNVITGIEKQEEFVAFTPVSAEGYNAKLSMVSPICANRNGFVVSADSPNWEAALKWWNYLSSSQEMAYFVHRGPEGLAYELEEDGQRYQRMPTDEELIEAGYEKYAGKVGTSAFSASLGAYSCSPLMLAPILQRNARREALANWGEYLPKETMSKAVVPAAKKEEFMFMTEGLTDAIKAFIATSIMDGVTDDSWNAYVANINALGYEYYVQYFQDYYDGKFVAQ